jgi:hypothetical protein
MGKGEIDVPFIALALESNHGLDPRLSGKKPFVPPTATFKIRKKSTS